jgi:hypothetical protein
MDTLCFLTNGERRGVPRRCGRESPFSANFGAWAVILGVIPEPPVRLAALAQDRLRRRGTSLIGTWNPQVNTYYVLVCRWQRGRSDRQTGFQVFRCKIVMRPRR